MPPKVKQGKGPAAQVLNQIWENALESLPVFLFGDGRQAGLVKTVNEHDAQNPVQPLPDRHHLRWLAEAFLDPQPLVIAKSRQMMVSWLVVSCILWDVLHPGRRWCIACKRLEDADGLLDRMWGVVGRFPGAVPGDKETKIPWLGLRFSRKEGLITVHHKEAKSTVQGIPQDSDAPRSRTFSGIFIDEAAFTDNLDALYTAAKPTVMGSGKLVMASSPNGRGLFYALLTDNGRLEI